jgi:hypothetical protein
MRWRGRDRSHSNVDPGSRGSAGARPYFRDGIGRDRRRRDRSHSNVDPGSRGSAGARPYFRHGIGRDRRRRDRSHSNVDSGSVPLLHAAPRLWHHTETCQDPAPELTAPAPSTGMHRRRVARRNRPAPSRSTRDPDLQSSRESPPSKDPRARPLRNPRPNGSRRRYHRPWDGADTRAPVPERVAARPGIAGTAARTRCPWRSRPCPKRDTRSLCAVCCLFVSVGVLALPCSASHRWSRASSLASSRLVCVQRSLLTFLLLDAVSFCVLVYFAVLF